MRELPVAFERGDTMVEFTRVVAEAAVRKGWEIGFASAYVFVTGKRTDDQIVEGLRIARRFRTALDIHWQALDHAMMLVISAGDQSDEEPSQIVGVTHRTYASLDDLEISNEPPEETDGGELD